MDKEDLSVIFSHKTDDWATPQWLFDKLNKTYHFTLDPAASDGNHKCSKYYTEQTDGLSKDWNNETVFINPPYSKIYDWVKKAVEEVNKNNITVVMILPVRSDTKWFHEFCLDETVCSEIAFFKGRLKFGEGKNSAPFPSMMVVFNKSGKTGTLFRSVPNKST